MDQNELIEFLKENLTIELNFKEGGRAYWDGDHRLTATIMLGDTKICSGDCSLPNDKQERPY